MDPAYPVTNLQEFDTQYPPILKPFLTIQNYIIGLNAPIYLTIAVLKCWYTNATDVNNNLAEHTAIN